MKSAIHSFLAIIVLFSCASISEAQNITQVFNNPEDFVGRTGTFRIWVDEKFMSRVNYFGPSSSGGSNTERVLDGFLMVVGDGRNNARQADKWGIGDGGVLAQPKINVFIDKILGTKLKERINGAAWATATFTIKEVKVGVKLDGEAKVIKIYVAWLRKIEALQDTSG
jgi:hypothetical protein